MHVTVESIVQYATLGTLVTALVSLVVWARIYRRQVNAQIIVELSARYATMFQSFPAQLRLAQFDSDRPLPERREEFTTYALQYASIVVFAYHLHERRYLTNDVWTILQAEHRRTVARPWFAREWNVVKTQFGEHPNFIAYMERFLPSSSR